VIRLTARQRQVLAFVADGLTNLEIAEQLRIGETTVEQHVRDVRSAYGASNPALAVALAMRRGDLT
jgi:DNA-binding NarL/FixJ family response regulator